MNRIIHLVCIFIISLSMGLPTVGFSMSSAGEDMPELDSSHQDQASTAKKKKRKKKKLTDRRLLIERAVPGLLKYLNNQLQIEWSISPTYMVSVVPDLKGYQAPGGLEVEWGILPASIQLNDEEIKAGQPAMLVKATIVFTLKKPGVSAEQFSARIQLLYMPQPYLHASVGFAEQYRVVDGAYDQMLPTPQVAVNKPQASLVSMLRRTDTHQTQEVVVPHAEVLRFIKQTQSQDDDDAKKD